MMHFDILVAPPPSTKKQDGYNYHISNHIKHFIVNSELNVPLIWDCPQKEPDGRFSNILKLE